MFLKAFQEGKGRWDGSTKACSRGPRSGGSAASRSQPLYEPENPSPTGNQSRIIESLSSNIMAVQCTRPSVTCSLQDTTIEAKGASAESN